MKNPKPLSNRNTPPKLTFHTFRSTSDHSKVLFWLPSDFWRIFSNNEKQQMPISQNKFDHKATKMVPIFLDLWVTNKFARKCLLFEREKNWTTVMGKQIMEGSCKLVFVLQQHVIAGSNWELGLLILLLACSSNTNKNSADTNLYCTQWLLSKSKWD